MSEVKRLILFAIFSFSMLMLWQAWQKDQRALRAPAAAQNAAAETGKSSIPVPAAPAPGTLPQVAKITAAPTQAAPVSHRERISIITDVIRAEVDTLGGDIVSLELLDHPDTIDQSKNFVLLGAQHHYAVQSGLTGEGFPNHKTVYSAAEKKYALNETQQKLEVRLQAQGINDASGVKVTKVITFHRGSYLIDITHEVANGSNAPIAPFLYAQITRDSKAPDGSQAMMATYTGPAVYTEQDKYHKVHFDDVNVSKPFKKSSSDGWIGMLQHYFVSALVPLTNQPREFYVDKLADDLFAVGVKSPLATLAPGASGSAGTSLYAGPQDQDKLKAIAPGLELVVDYGWLTVIAAPLFWVLQFFHGWLGNWGLAIIFLTVSIKLIFFPLSAASYRSMAKMKQVTPRLTKLREQYGDDRMKMNQAMMELYKQEKINPLGGCLPIVVQIPVFIALYWVLLASVELRHAPFYGWIVDLASADPYYILPALMMASMIVQTKMSPTPPDPVQAKVMQFMPLIFGIMFFIFPAGLVLYWLVNNVLSILQQWYVNRSIEMAKLAAATKR